MDEYVTMEQLQAYVTGKNFMLNEDMLMEVSLYVEEKYDILAAFLGTFEGG